MESTNELVNVTEPMSGVLQVQLNRPQQLNALNHTVLQKLAEIFTSAKNNSKVKALLLTGTGKAFCAGADITELASLDSKNGITFASFGQSVMNQLEMLGKPSLAVVNGYALGGGCELAMAATLRIAATEAIFGQPEIKLGVIPGFGGTQRLSRLIGKGRALEICLTGKRFSADQAYQWGMVNEVISSDKLLDRAKEILRDLVQMGPVAMQSVISVINDGYNLPLESALAYEAAHFGLCCATADKQEGVSAFLEKRVAAFSGE